MSSANPWNLKSCQGQISRFRTPHSFDCVQVFTFRPRPDYLFSFETTKVFFPFFKNSPSPRGVFESLLYVQTCPFRLKAQKLFPFLIISLSTRGVFDTVTSSFSKSPVFKILHENSAFTREIVSSEKFHYCITLRYFDQGCLSLVTISLHSFTDGSSSKVVTEWRKCQDPQSRN